MSGVSGHNGYYLKKSGERVNDLLSRQFIVPTLEVAPTIDTLSWADGEYEVEFRIGEFVRVPDGSDYVFYRLKDINDNGAVWVNATSADMKDYYTKQEIDDKISNLVISGGSGGVVLISEEDYAAKKENGEIVDNVLYFIVVNDEPYELYIGLHLIAKKSEIESLGFPYTFPITF